MAVDAKNAMIHQPQRPQSKNLCDLKRLKIRDINAFSPKECTEKSFILCFVF